MYMQNKEYEQMLSTSYKNFVDCARTIPGFIVGQKEDVPYDITELINGYCAAKDAGDETKKSQFMSALFIRYWHMAVYLYKQSLSTRLEFDDILSWMYDAFEKAAYYRSWQDANKEVSKSPKGAEKCINQCITSIRQYWYKNFNQDNRKANFTASSLDVSVPSADDESGTAVVDTLTDSSDDVTIDGGRELIRGMFDSGRYLEALVLDGILNHECFTDVKGESCVSVDSDGNEFSYRKHSSAFSGTKLRKHLRELNDAVIDDLASSYDADRAKLAALAEDLRSMPKSRFAKRVSAAFAFLHDSKEVRELCM